MSNLEFNTKLLDEYLNLLSSLSVNAKKYLIEKLEKSLIQKPNNINKSDLFGAWDSTKSSDDLINEIYSNRSFNRSIEGFE